jgi:hypothetical protein
VAAKELRIVAAMCAEALAPIARALLVFSLALPLAAVAAGFALFTSDFPTTTRLGHGVVFLPDQADAIRRPWSRVNLYRQPASSSTLAPPAFAFGLA